jgi:hypothetical protein
MASLTPEEESKKVEEAFNRIASRKLNGTSSSRWTTVIILILITILIVTATGYYIYKKKKVKIERAPAPVNNAAPVVIKSE